MRPDAIARGRRAVGSPDMEADPSLGGGLTAEVGTFMWSQTHPLLDVCVGGNISEPG